MLNCMYLDGMLVVVVVVVDMGLLQHLERIQLRDCYRISVEEKDEN